MSKFKEIGWLFEVVEFHKWYENAFIYEKQRIKEGFFNTEGSNIGKGKEGMKKEVYRLPYYDIIWLASMGVYTTSIVEQISKNYEASESAVAGYIYDKREGFGGTYQMQKEFLKPVVEELYKKGISGIEIFKALNEIEDLTTFKSPGNTWLVDWARGGDWIEINGKKERRYYGETLEFWADYFFEQAEGGMSGDDATKELAGKLGIVSLRAANTRTTILNKLGFSSWRRLRTARQIIAYLKNCPVGEAFSYESVSKKTGFHKTTIKTYFAIFEEQGLIYKRIPGERDFYFLHD